MSKVAGPIPVIPDVPENLDEGLREFLTAVKTNLDVLAGRAVGHNVRAVTIADLVTAGVVADGVIK